MTACVTLWINADYRCLQWNLDWYDLRGDRIGCVVHTLDPQPSTVGEALEEALDRLAQQQEQLRFVL